ncbi:MAG: ATP-binding protein [Candidatus Beckwithbacteria bacterium]|nr:ATP-binding protein [Patescibacteria group bacterium]
MIKRSIYPDLVKHLQEKEITLITGPRQAGKTTLMNIMKKDLSSIKEKSLYLNLDLENDYKIFKSQENLINHLKLHLGTAKKSYVFIDEIQRKENAGLFLKGLFDSNLPYKFIISGSGSVELKEKVSEGLAGRKKTFKLRTLSFQEFIDYKTKYKFSSNLDDYFASSIYSNSILDEYLQFGGYPKLILKETIQEKRDILESIYESYVDKDLKDLLNIKNTEAVTRLLTFLSTRIGKLTATSEISNRINLNYDTTKQYLHYLKKTFQIESIQPFSRNSESEIVKTPIYYFTDLGMRNFVFNRLSHYDAIVSGGMLFQNFVYLLLSENHLVSKVNFWRTKEQAEVDFIVNVGSILIPVEVKFSKIGKNVSVGRSVHSYIKKYSPKKLLVVNLDTTKKLKIKNTVVKFVPYYDLVTQNIVDL